MSHSDNAVPADETSAAGNRLVGFITTGLGPTAACLALYFLVSLGLRLALPDALTLDEAEQSLFSQYWLFGYGPQPPFFNWVQKLFVDAMGLSLLSLALPKFAMLFLCYLFFGMAAREIDRQPSFIAAAMLSLILLPQVSYMPQQDLTHTVALLMATALFFYGICRTLNRPDWLGYAVTGIAIGIGILSKYNFVLLPAATLIAILCEKQWRGRLFDPRILLVFAVSLAIVLPHALWLFDHLDVATRGTITKMTDEHGPHGLLRILRGLLSLVIACLAFSALCLVALALAFRSQIGSARRAESPWTRLFGRIMLLSLAGVVLVILFTDTSKITERWLDPYLLVLPLYLLARLKAADAGITAPLRRLAPFILVLMVIAILPAPLRVVTAGLTGSANRLNMPFADLAGKIRQEGEPAVIFARGMHLAGNMRMQFPKAVVINADATDRYRPDFKGLAPVLLIEALPDGEAPDATKALAVPDGIDAPAPAEFVSLPYFLSSRREAAFRYGWVPEALAKPAN